jgi:hypothetical protein
LLSCFIWVSFLFSLFNFLIVIFLWNVNNKVDKINGYNVTNDDDWLREGMRGWGREKATLQWGCWRSHRKSELWNLVGLIDFVQRLRMWMRIWG